MANVSVYNMEGKEVGTIELNDAVFGVEINENLVHKAVVAAAREQPSGHAEGKDPFRGFRRRKKAVETEGNRSCKTGIHRAPQWTGGGVVFAPVPRDYSIKMNKKEKRAALKSALTSKVQENKFLVLDELKFARSRPRSSMKGSENLKVEKALVVIADDMTRTFIFPRETFRSTTASAGTLNVFDVLKYNTVIATKSSVAAIEEVYA
jgi:large subunit ribosomal protein L4